jgi:hypothetical protein
VAAATEHDRAPGGSSNGTSSASMIVTGPVTFSGPFARTWIVTSVMTRL